MRRRRGDCAWSNTVILAENLACVGRECDADALRVVQVAEPTATSTAIHYEYVRPPCKEQVFYANAKKVTNKERWAYSSCANPLLVRLCVFFIIYSSMFVPWLIISICFFNAKTALRVRGVLRKQRRSHRRKGPQLLVRSRASVACHCR